MSRPAPLFLAALVVSSIAIALAILTFTRADAQTRRDRVANEAARLATDAQAWARTPGILGGGGGSLASFQPEHVGRQPDRAFVLTALDTPAPVVIGRDEAGRPVARVAIWGPGADCLVTTLLGETPTEAVAFAPPVGCQVW